MRQNVQTFAKEKVRGWNFSWRVSIGFFPESNSFLTFYKKEVNPIRNFFEKGDLLKSLTIRFLSVDFGAKILALSKTLISAIY